MGESTVIDMEKICRAMGAKVEVSDPFDLEKTRKKLELLLRYAEAEYNHPAGLRADPEKRGRKKFEVLVDEARCRGDDCGCNSLCTRLLRLPGLIWDRETKR